MFRWQLKILEWRLCGFHAECLCAQAARIYSLAGMGEFWIVNRFDRLVEIYKDELNKKTEVSGASG